MAVVRGALRCVAASCVVLVCVGCATPEERAWHRSQSALEEAEGEAKKARREADACSAAGDFDGVRKWEEVAGILEQRAEGLTKLERLRARIAQGYDQARDREHATEAEQELELAVAEHADKLLAANVRLRHTPLMRLSLAEIKSRAEAMRAQQAADAKSEEEAKKEAGTRKAREKAAGHVKELASADAEKRAEAAYALGKLGDRRAIPALIIALDDSDPGVVRSASWALGALKAKVAVPKLLSLLSDTRWQGSLLPYGLRSEDEVDQALSNVDPVGAWAAFALGEICDPGDTVAVDVLEKARSAASEDDHKKFFHDPLQKIRTKPILKQIAGAGSVEPVAPAPAETAPGALYYETACEKLAADLSSALADAKGVRLAAYEFHVKGTEGRTHFGALISANVEIGLQKFTAGAATLVERSRIDAALREQALQRAGMFDRAHQVRLGELVGANTILTGEIFAMPSTFTVVASLVDVQTGRVLKKGSVKMARSMELNILLASPDEKRPR